MSAQRRNTGPQMSRRNMLAAMGLAGAAAVSLPALSAGRLTAAAPARPMAASMFRRDICGPYVLRCALIAAVLNSGGDQGDLDGFLAAGDKVETLLEVCERQLMCADVIHRQHAGLDHLDGCGPAVRA